MKAKHERLSHVTKNKVRVYENKEYFDFNHVHRMLF